MKDTLDKEYLYLIQLIMQFFLSKLNHYGVCGVSNDCFRSYLSNQQQYVSINGWDSCLTKINCGIPQGSGIF